MVRMDFKDLSHKDEILSFLGAIASSPSKVMIVRNTEVLKSSEVWKKSPRLQEYYSRHWELHIEVKALEHLNNTAYVKTLGLP